MKYKFDTAGVLALYTVFIFIMDTYWLEGLPIHWFDASVILFVGNIIVSAVLLYNIIEKDVDNKGK